MYGVASEISTRAAFSVPTLLPIPPQAYTYAKKKNTLTQPEFHSILFLTPLNY